MTLIHEIAHGEAGGGVIVAAGFISSLHLLGYGTAEKPVPIIARQDSERTAIRYSLVGKQSTNVFSMQRRSPSFILTGAIQVKFC